MGDEHLATAITQEVLGRLFPRALQTQPRSRERVMLAGVQGEHHVLGLRMAADVLEGAGFDVLYLGGDVPLEGLETCRAHAPAVLGFSVSMPLNLPTLIWEIQAVCALESLPHILAAGRAVGPAIEHDLAVPIIESTEQVVEAVEGLLAKPLLGQVLSATLAAQACAPNAIRPIEPTNSPTYEDRFALTAQSGAESACDSARHALAMEQLAYRDPLTGLCNRRGYDDRYYEVMESTSPDAMVLMIDIDGFKGIDGTHGHEAGECSTSRRWSNHDAQRSARGSRCSLRWRRVRDLAPWS